MHDLYSGASMSRVVLKSSFSLSTPLSPLPLPLSLSVLSSLSHSLSLSVLFSLPLSTSLSFLFMSLSLSRSRSSSSGSQRQLMRAATSCGWMRGKPKRCRDRGERATPTDCKWKENCEHSSKHFRCRDSLPTADKVPFEDVSNSQMVST